MIMHMYIFRSMNIECVNIFENQDSKSNYFPFQHRSCSRFDFSNSCDLNVSSVSN